MKKRFEIVNVDEEIFKRIKKNKPIIYVSQANETLENLKEKEKIILQSSKNNKKLVRKIKTKYQAQNYEELGNILGKRSKKLYPKNIKDENLIAIELKTKSKILSKIFLIILTLLVMILSYYFLSNSLMRHNNNKLQDEIKKVTSEITYVIIEINPKIILELKDGKVINTGCLNEDCLSVFDDIDLKDSSLKEATEKLYNKAKEKNVDVSNGVSVSSSNQKVEKEVNKLDYVKYKKIDKKEEKEEIKNVIDNKEIKEEKNKNEVSNDILAIYKKDKDYGILYECKVVNSEPVCYITRAFAERLSYEGDTLEEFINSLNEMRNLENILDKFEFDYERGGVEGLNQTIVNRIAVSGTSYPIFYGFSLSSNVVSASPDENNESLEKYSEYTDFGITIYDSNWYLDAEQFKVIVLPIEKVELISRTYEEKDLVILTDVDGYLNISKNS